METKILQKFICGNIGFKYLKVQKSCDSNLQKEKKNHFPQELVAESSDYKNSLG